MLLNEDKKPRAQFRNMWDESIGWSGYIGTFWFTLDAKSCWRIVLKTHERQEIIRKLT